VHGKGECVLERDKERWGEGKKKKNGEHVLVCIFLIAAMLTFRPTPKTSKKEKRNAKEKEKRRGKK